MHCGCVCSPLGYRTLATFYQVIAQRTGDYNVCSHIRDPDYKENPVPICMRVKKLLRPWSSWGYDDGDCEISQELQEAQGPTDNWNMEFAKTIIDTECKERLSVVIGAQLAEFRRKQDQGWPASNKRWLCLPFQLMGNWLIRGLSKCSGHRNVLWTLCRNSVPCRRCVLGLKSCLVPHSANLNSSAKVPADAQYHSDLYYSKRI